MHVCECMISSMEFDKSWHIKEKLFQKWRYKIFVFEAVFFFALRSGKAYFN